MCDCLDAIAKELKALQNDNTQVDISMSIVKGKPNRALVKTVKRDDSKREKPKTLIAAYCPFCGKEYAQEEPKP